MLSGHISENSRLNYLPKPLQKAVEYLQQINWVNHEPGRFELDQDNMILQVLDLSTASRETLRPECHKKYVDVQFLAAGGPEKIGWYPDLGNNEIDENLLDTPRDICFYKNNPKVLEGIIPMSVGSYAMFFPWDVHIPAIAVTEPVAIRKIVIKVKFDLCLSH